jgi:hypothetical protein
MALAMALKRLSLRPSSGFPCAREAIKRCEGTRCASDNWVREQQGGGAGLG